MHTSLITLRAGELQLDIAPHVGGSIARFARVWKQDGRERSVEWLRPASQEGLQRANPLAMASFPLVPFCNRIRNGRASFGGREIRFPPNHPAEHSPHPLHGIGWLQPWQVEDQDANNLTLTLEVQANEAWPWSFRAAQHYQLESDALRVDMRITNTDSAAMPAGIGHHPYFPHLPGTRLTAPTRAMWATDAEVMPTELVESDAVKRLREGVVVDELVLDNNFIDWSREALVEWPADALGPQRSLRMAAEAPLDFFVLYSPKGYDHFCAEPVSQCTDWLNLSGRYGNQELGGTVIAPGHTLGASFSLEPRWRE